MELIQVKIEERTSRKQVGHKVEKKLKIKLRKS